MNSISESNKEIIKILTTNKNFSLIRIGAESSIVIEYCLTNNIDTKYFNENITLFNAGIYSRSNDKIIFEKFCKIVIESYKNSSILAYINMPGQINKMQDYIINNYNLFKIHSRALEPFYIVNENEKPWTHYLKGKKVLIINPFVESFKKQLKNKFQIFKDPDKKIFLDDQEFIFYKAYQTSAGNHIHEDWYETYNLMCNDIKKLDFDIALLGCGGYGLPLCNFIKMNMNKSAIYIGGGLQLLFGVMGRRWENRDDWKKIIRDNDTKFIRPSGDEILRNKDMIEQGCYW